MIYRNISERRGFALLVTIVLVAFLVLILVGLATFTRVETQVAANAQNIAAARQNALTALNIAVGQLQRYAGPDQRVTAPADIKGDASGNRDTAVKNPFYTGVWNATPTDAILPPALNPSTPLAWLVSGSETATAPLATTDYSASGELLVGPNSTSNATQYVYVPLGNLTSSNVPGLPAGNTTIGRYAYWVGDEGVKARLNLTDKLAPRAAATGGSPAAFSPSATQESLRLSAAQRMGVERMPGLGAIAGIHNNTTAGADTAALLSRTLTPNQLPFVDSTITTARPRELFHDVSTVSNSVLSDTVNGGLRADLTYLFEQSSPANFRTEMNKVLTGANAIGAAGQANPTDTQIVPKIVGSNAKYAWAQGPTWYQLRSFYLLGRGTGSEGAVDGAGNYVPRAHRADVHGLYPIITQFRMKFGIQARLTAPDTYRMEGVFSPLLVIANPYNVRIAAQDLLFNVDFNGGTPFFMKGVNQSGAWGSVNIAPIYFRIEGVALEPGEARVFTLRDGVVAEGWNSALGCYDYNPAVTRRFPMENDLNLDDRRIAIITGSTTATTAEIVAGLPDQLAGVYQNRASFSGEIRMRLFLDTGALTTPVAAQLLQRFEWSLNGNGAIGNGGINIGAIQNATPGTYLLAWAPSASDSLGVLMASPLTSPTINMYQSVNPRAPLRARFNTAAGGGSIVNSGYSSANPTPWRGNMIIMTDNQRAYWGMRNRGSNAPANDTSAAGGGAPAALEKAVLYDAPSNTAPIVSLGQLQHFNPAGFPNPASTSPSDEISRSQCHGQAFAIGNSRASLFVTRNAYDEVNANAAGARLLKDTSYLLNRALWDSFFFSTVPQAGAFDFNAGDLLGNPRLSPFRPEIASSSVASYRSGPFDASRNLLLAGGFNINSTSLEAWRALFSSLNQIPYPGTATALTGAYARSLKQPGGIAGTTSGDNGVTVGAWSGYRNLTNDQIDALATEMVKQVRLRGPFAGLTDFVNRRVENTNNGLMGALQAAIEATEAYAAATRLNNKVGGTAGNPLYFNAPAGADAARIKDAAHHETMQVAGIPGIIKQADLLQALGPVITARSDTFIVRTYGEVVNPVTNNTEGRAWLEAVVQRLPDFVDTANDAAELQSALNATNTSFGRRFRVVSFRWLSSDDI